MPIVWTDWMPLGGIPRQSERTLRETLNGGQAFRWSFDSVASHWQGTWASHVARIRLANTGELTASVPVGSESTLTALGNYLGDKVDWDAMADALPWRSDEHLQNCARAYPGLRLLQQPFPETLLAFLCSATKQIPQIKIMCANLAQAFGSEIAPGIRSLPTWEQLAAASESDLRALGLGFRAKNIKKTADLLAEQPAFLDAVASAPYTEAKQQLMELPGVGEKIADCALLFGAAQWQAFPVDTWIIKVLERRYALHGWTPSQLAQFGRIHFGPYAGYAQQFLFAYERSLPASASGMNEH